MDGTSQNIRFNSFRSGVIIIDDVDLFEYCQFQVEAPAVSGGATVGKVVGLDTPFLYAGIGNIGIRNSSAYVAARPLVGQSITSASDQVLPAEETAVLVPNAAYTLTVNPPILNGAELGQRLRLLNAGSSLSRTITFPHGAGVDTGTGLSFTLRPGMCIDLEYRASSGNSRWVIVAASQSNGFITGDVAGGGSARVKDSGANSLRLAFSGVDADATEKAAIGLAGGSGYWAFGPGGSAALDVTCTRVGTAKAEYSGSLDVVDGRLREIRSSYAWTDDLTRFLTPVTTDNVLIGATEFKSALNGTGAQISQTGPASFTAGAASLATGSTTTGRCGLTPPGMALLYLRTEAWRFFARFRIPALSTSTDLFEVRLGFLNTLGAALTNGLYLRRAQLSANFEAVSLNASTATATNTGVSATANQWYNLAIDHENSGTKFYLDGTLVATHASSAGPPDLTAQFAGCAIFKNAGSVGTTSRSLEVDFLSGTMPITSRGDMPALISA